MTYFSHYYKAPFSIHSQRARASTESLMITDTTHMHGAIMHGLPKKIKLSCRVIALEIGVSYLATNQDFLVSSPGKVQIQIQDQIYKYASHMSLRWRKKN